jgi:hypothetical protein
VKNTQGLVAAVAVLVALTVAAGVGYAELWNPTHQKEHVDAGGGGGLGMGGGGGRQGWFGPLPFRAVLSAEQRNSVRSFVQNDKTNIETLRNNVHQAKRALMAALLSSGSNSAIQSQIANEVHQLNQARAALMNEKIKMAMQTRSSMSTEQLTQAGSLWSKLQSLRQQEKALFQQARAGE